MKRDMDLVRLILLAIEEAETATLPGVPAIGEHERAVVVYHVEKLLQAELLQAVAFRPLKGLPEFHNIGMTWQGHEFLDSVRNPEIWRKTKEGATKVGSWSIGVLAEIAKAVIAERMRALGLSVGA